MLAAVNLARAAGARVAPLPARLARAGARHAAAAASLQAPLRLRAASARARAPSPAGARRAAARASLQDAVTQPETRAAAADPRREDTPAVAPPPGVRSPADADRQNFQLHWSVDMWRDYDPRAWFEAAGDAAAPLPARAGAFVASMRSLLSTSGALASPQTAAYWAYCLLRSGFFVAQGALGLTAARAALSGSGAAADTAGPVSKLEALLRDGWQGPIGEAMLMYWQDYELVKEGAFALPWDATTPTHRQFNPFFIGARAAAFASEAAATLRRRAAGRGDPAWLSSPFLPSYYADGFHYQTDGWLSRASAKVYESSTETLFVGRQDAAQRCTLVALSAFMAGRDAAQTRALELGCGTGRFATFVKDNFPRLDLTASDLSPFYLEEARANVRYWHAQRAGGAPLGGAGGAGVAFLQTPAEAIAAPDASFDVVYSVYLLHELPPAVRRRVAAEAARVLRPGGLLVVTDSTQLGDRPAFDATLGNFTNFQEPFYTSYINEDLGALFSAEGLVPELKVVGSTTKALSFRKPEAPGAAAAAGAAAADVDASIAADAGAAGADAADLKN